MEWIEDNFRDESARESDGKKREFVGIFWECCKVYSRIYLNSRGTAFVGWCPKCARRVQMNISQSGSKSRFFNVG